MAEQRDYLIRWLNDAYSMEKSIEHTLQNHIKDFDELPEVKSLLQVHLEVTQTQSDRVKAVIEKLGGNLSEAESGFSQMLGMIKEVPNNISKDEIVKNALADYATEHFEIASYTSLRYAALMCGEQEVADLCEVIIKEELEMANRFSQYIPQITEHFLRLQENKD